MDLLMANSRPVMLVGGAGCGKTVLVNNKLNALQDTTLITVIPFNHYTTSLMLQGVMEGPLEKKSGRFALTSTIVCVMR
jgi:dynein heavy chain